LTYLFKNRYLIKACRYITKLWIWIVAKQRQEIEEFTVKICCEPEHTASPEYKSERRSYELSS